MKRFLRKCMNYRYLLLMLLPCMLFVIVFNYIPMAGVVLAFKNYSYKDGILAAHGQGGIIFDFSF